MLIRGVFLTSTVSFEGREDFHNWLLLIGGAVLALIGSFTVLGRRRAA
jgi:LPXTG-motif cell wall-anchored protein